MFRSLNKFLRQKNAEIFGMSGASQIYLVLLKNKKVKKIFSGNKGQLLKLLPAADRYIGGKRIKKFLEIGSPGNYHAVLGIVLLEKAIDKNFRKFRFACNKDGMINLELHGSVSVSFRSKDVKGTLRKLVGALRR